MEGDRKAIAICSLLSSLVSSVIVFSILHFTDASINSCLHLPRLQFASLGAAIVAAAALSAAASFSRKKWPVALTLSCATLLAVAAMLFVALTFLNTRVGGGRGGEQQSATAAGGYHLSDFAAWMREKVEEMEKWEEVQQCVGLVELCEALGQQYRSDEIAFDEARLTPLQLGCCTPPRECGFRYIDATYWLFPERMGESSDCGKWSNNQTILCSECDACMAAALATVAFQWRKVALFSSAALVAFSIFNISAWVSYCASACRRRHQHTRK